MIEIYGFDEKYFNCVPCQNAKRFCSARKKDYTFKSVVNGKDGSGLVFDEPIVDELLQRLGRESKVGLTMPQVFVDGVSIGGFDKLREYKF